MNNLLSRIFKLKGQTSDVQVFNPPALTNFVLDISLPLRGFWLFVKGQLQTAAGGTDPNPSMEVLLKMLGTIEVTLQRDGGNLNLIPAGTPLRFFYRSMQSLARSMKSQTDKFLYTNPPSAQNLGTNSVLDPTGLAAAGPENFAAAIYIPFQFLGGNDSEQDLGLYVPKTGDKQINVIVTPGFSLGAQNVGNVSNNSPFPGTNNTYSMTGLNGVGSAVIQCILDQVQTVVPANMGKFLPVWQQMSTILASGAQPAAIVTPFQNWERGGLWHSIFINDTNFITAAGSDVENNHVGPSNFPGTPLEDFVLLGNTNRLLEQNIKNLAMMNGRGAQGIQFPMVINLTGGRSAFGLYDFTPLIAKNLQINIEFDNTTNIGAGTQEQIEVGVLRYLPR